MPQPYLTQRLPEKLEPKDHILTSSGREITFIEPSAYVALRKIQLQNKLEGNHAAGFYTVLDDPRNPENKLALKSPVFISETGDMIAISSTMLGKGTDGIAHLGMDIETGQLVAVKQKAMPVVEGMKLEAATMSAVGRLVAEYHSGNESFAG